MKECSREEVLKGKKSQYDPPNPSRSSVGPGGQRDQEHGVVLHDQEEGYQPPMVAQFNILGLTLSTPGVVFHFGHEHFKENLGNYMRSCSLS